MAGMKWAMPRAAGHDLHAAPYRFGDRQISAPIHRDDRNSYADDERLVVCRLLIGTPVPDAGWPASCAGEPAALG